MPPTKRTLISKYPGNSVPANDSAITTIGATPIPQGKTLNLTCFGAALTHVGRVELQLRTQVTPSEKWRTLRCVIGPGHHHYEHFQPIEGDGTIAALRMVRFNDDSEARNPKGWIEGYRR